MKANRFLAKVLAVTLVFGAVGAVLPNTVSNSYSITASAAAGEGTRDDPYCVSDYETLKSIIDEAPTEGTTYIQLVGSVEINDTTSENQLKIGSPLTGKKGQTIDLDLNGYSFTRNYTDRLDIAAVIVYPDSTLNIRDETGYGTMECNMPKSNSRLIYNKGKLNIYGGKLRNFNEKEQDAKCIENDGELNIYGGDFVAYGKVLTLVSGTVNIFDANFYVSSNCKAEDLEKMDYPGIVYMEKSDKYNVDLNIYKCTMTSFENDESNLVSISVRNDSGKLGSESLSGIIGPDSKIYCDGVATDGQDSIMTAHTIEIGENVSAVTKGSGTKSSPYEVGDYGSLRELIYNAPSGKNTYFRLTDDIKINEATEEFALKISDFREGNRGQEITIDLNGHILSKDPSGRSDDHSAIIVYSDGKLNITDSKGNGAVESNIPHGYTVMNLGKLNIFGGTFKNNDTTDYGDSCIYTDKGSTNIYGGSFSSYGSALDYRAGELNIFGGEFIVSSKITAEQLKNSNGAFTGDRAPGMVLSFDPHYTGSYDITIHNCKLRTLDNDPEALVNISMINREFNLVNKPIDDYLSFGSKIYLDGSDKPINANTNRVSAHTIEIRNCAKKADINADDKIDVEDAVYVINNVNGNNPLNAEQLMYADVDESGNVDIEDAVAIISHVNGVKPLE